MRATPAHAVEQVELRAEYAASVPDDRCAEDAVRSLSQQPGVSSAR